MARSLHAPDDAPADPERELHLRVRAGDDRALAELVTRYWARIRQWALWECGDLPTADDACQETWLRLSRAAPTLDPDRNVAGWVRSLVRRACQDLVRRDRRWARVPAVPEGVRVGADHDLDVRRGAAQMLAAFATLTPRQREALDLVDRGGLSPAEAADRMGATPATVRALLHQGRKALREAGHPELRDLIAGSDP
jgi:RNA polymerase sigma-70 factor (ECF subfamily)